MVNDVFVYEYIVEHKFLLSKSCTDGGGVLLGNGRFINLCLRSPIHQHEH
jgi:hypothetical protein